MRKEDGKKIKCKKKKSYTEFIKSGTSMESRRDRTGQKNILLSCPIPLRLHARSRLYEFGVWTGQRFTIFNRGRGGGGEEANSRPAPISHPITMIA